MKTITMLTRSNIIVIMVGIILDISILMITT